MVTTMQSRYVPCNTLTELMTMFIMMFHNQDWVCILNFFKYFHIGSYSTRNQCNYNHQPSCLFLESCFGLMMGAYAWVPGVSLLNGKREIVELITGLSCQPSKFGRAVLQVSCKNLTTSLHWQYIHQHKFV